ncbi:MAG: ABC transporter substrate-binding protein [Deinococcota bacterium]
MKNLLTLLAAIVLGFSSAQDDSSPVATTDMINRDVELPELATEIIPLNITALGQLLALDIEPAGIWCQTGSTEYSAELMEERNMPIPSDTPCYSGEDGYDWEVIAALNADLVIGWGQEEADIAEAIVPFFGTQTYSVDGGDSFDMYDESLRAIAQLTGMEEKAEEVIAATRDRAEAYTSIIEDRATVLHMGTSDAEEFWVFGQPSLNCTLLDEIADCVAPGPASNFYANGTSEMVLSVDPDVILVVNRVGTDEALMEALAANLLWGELSAVQEGRVYIMPHDSRPSSIWGINDYLDTVAPLIYPDLFPDGPLTNEQVQEILANQ